MMMSDWKEKSRETERIRWNHAASSCTVNLVDNFAIFADPLLNC